MASLFQKFSLSIELLTTAIGSKFYNYVPGYPSLYCRVSDPVATVDLMQLNIGIDIGRKLHDDVVGVFVGVLVERRDPQAIAAAVLFRLVGFLLQSLNPGT